MSDLEPPKFEWITDAAGVQRLAELMRDAAWCAVDSESNSMFVYRERVCLVQLSVEGRLFVIDPLLTDDPRTWIAPLAESLERSDQPCFLHGGEYDVACFKRAFGISLGGVFDSQQAAAFLGWERTGYGALAEAVCGVKLDKGYAQYDWATRPLDPDALQYALADVIYLPAIIERLQADIAGADLGGEIAVANQAVMAVAPHGVPFGSANLYRVKGIRDLNATQKQRLWAVMQWRERVAQDLNYPPGRLFNDRSILAVVRADPRSVKELRRLRVGGRVLRVAEGLLTCLADAQRSPPELPERPVIPRLSGAERARGERLKAWRRGEAQRRSVPIQVVLPARALDTLQRSDGADLDLGQVPQLGPKRIALYGDVLRELCQKPR